MSYRLVTEVVRGREVSEGAGVRLRRMIGTRELDHVDPFLLFDEFKSEEGADYVAGFPDHPHRGFETVTYMLAGSMEHKDHAGNHGLLRAGSVQWMTAGRGIIHSEMPKQEQGLLWGYQLWVNLPARAKMSPPRYQDIAPEDVPELARHDGVRVRVVAGESGGLKGAVTGIATAPLYLDVFVPTGARFEQEVPDGDAAFAYVFEAAAAIGTDTDPGREVKAGELALLGDGSRISVRASGGDTRLLLLAARPLREPVARYGPFVMNTREEIEQAIEDFRTGRLLDA